MENIVDVNLWDDHVGSLFWDKERDVAIFEYNPSFILKGLDISPIAMPLRTASGNRYVFLENKTNCFKGLPGLIADSLPDKYGNQIIDAWFASKGFRAMDFTPLDRLCYVGKRAMGALEFFPSESIEGLDSSTVLEIGELTELAGKVLNDREQFLVCLKDRSESVKDILKIGTSAGGAKPKAIIAYNESTGEVRSGQVNAPDGFKYYLIKFDGVEDIKLSDNPKGVGNIEYAYYKMALDCGISMMECRLLPDNGYFHFMTERFDRTDGGEKIHTQTLSAMAHFDRDARYSYEQAFQVLRMLKLPAADSMEFFRRMVFNVVARNHDDHTKNHSFLMDRSGAWRLAPAYDLSFAYSENGRWTNRHQMSLNGKRDNFEYEDLLIVGKRQGIQRPEDIIDQVIEVVSCWKQYANDAGVHPEHRDLVEKAHLLLRKSALVQKKNSGKKK